MKNRKKKLLINYLISSILLTILIYSSSVLFYKYLIYSEVKDKYFALKENIQKTKKNINETDEKIKNLDSESGAEEMILNKFMVKKSGEKVIEIIE